MDKLREVLSDVSVPNCNDKIYKDECILSFDNPESETGLYVCLHTFLGLGRSAVEEYSRKTNHKLFLHIHRIKKELPPEKEVEPEKKIARLAIGVEGGFQPDTGEKKYHIDEYTKLVLLPDFISFPYPNDELPEIVRQCVLAILHSQSALTQASDTTHVWDGEVRQVTRHAETLLQLDNGVKVPPRGWKCARCELTANLWMNLTDGVILCGRKQLDGSGGNNHALEHYQKTKYPLAVKLGTISAEGEADVYSYDEDDMVLDPHLGAHLERFGIYAAAMQKSDRTMAELEIDYNQRAWEWSRLTEAGGALRHKSGPGFTGLRNLGNSCYLNSVAQVLFTVPSFAAHFYEGRDALVAGVPYTQAPHDFNVQMAKFAHGLLSGRYSKGSGAGPPAEGELQQGLSPVMFRALVGRGHPEFSTRKQQDAMEFLEHVLKLTARNAIQRPDPGHCFKFQVEDRFVCSKSGKVRYVTRSDLYLPLPVPLEEAINKEEVAAAAARKAEARAANVPSRGDDDQIHSKIPFEACLARLAAPEDITAFSSAIGREVPMKKVTRLTTFPDYLFIQLVKFGLSSEWQPVKFDVSIPMPDVLDLSSLRGGGLQPGEEVMPDAAPMPSIDQSSSVTFASGHDQGTAVDETVVAQLAEMGFPEAACRKALRLTGNWGSEAALAWIMEHLDDPDFADPLPPPDTAPPRSDTSASGFTPDEEGVAMLGSMGFSPAQSRLALRETRNSLERAVDWIFSHQPQLDALVAAEAGVAVPAPPTAPPFTDGTPKYELVAFISHMGTSIYVGHYVCHMKKGADEWVIFNDEKVYRSEAPPKDLGYIYLYRRLKD